MSEPTRSTATPKPAFTAAAWVSLLIPVVATVAFLITNDPEQRGPRWVFPVLFLTYAVAFVLGCVGLVGIRWNKAWPILLPLFVALPANAVLAVLALIFWALSGLPRSA